jgi:hypothetical protein
MLDEVEERTWYMKPTRKALLVSMAILPSEYVTPNCRQDGNGGGLLAQECRYESVRQRCSTYSGKLAEKEKESPEEAKEAASGEAPSEGV